MRAGAPGRGRVRLPLGLLAVLVIATLGRLIAAAQTAGPASPDSARGQRSPNGADAPAGTIGSAVSPPPIEPAAADAGRVDFTRQIRPLLSDRCFRCHGPDAGKRKAKLRLDLREGALKALEDGWAIVKPHDPEKSELIHRISSADPDEMMPPPESHLTLSAAERALLRRWVSEGADYRPHWSLAPVPARSAIAVPVAVPAPDPIEPIDPLEPLEPTKPNAPSAPIDRSEPSTPVARVNPIDAFVRASLRQEGIAPAPQASPETLIRRLAFNLTGLPPTPAEIDAFLADRDRSPHAYDRLVERYLASPAYGERMAMDWLDLARYADTYGYQADVERDMSPYRDWVIRAFNENLSYDRFLVWQLAGDLLPNATRAQRIATAFNRLHRQTNEGGSIDDEFRTEYVVDRVNTFGTAMLGLTMECARCHDHKFDPITQRDYYSLFAFFNSIDESGLYSHFTNATPSPSLLLWPGAKEQEHRRQTARIAALEASLKAIARTARPAYRAWRRQAVRVETPAPIAHLAFDTVTGDATPDSASANGAAQLKDGPVLVREPFGGAFRFSGDNSVVHPGVRTFSRTDSFSFAIRLKPVEAQERAIVLHQSRAWSDAGSRGFELTLERGRVFFGLIHFWPGNAIAVRARQPLPLDAWSHLVVTYDGSSRADGIRLFLNGLPFETDIVRDRLYKDITYSRTMGDLFAEKAPLTIAARFRDSGFKNGLIDDLQVFDVALTEAEAGALVSQASETTMFAHFLARWHRPYLAGVAQLRKLREAENALVAGVPEIMVMEEMLTPRPAHLLARGAYDAPGVVVPRDTPGSLPPFPGDQPRNRLGLARWLTSRQHPLAARVVVNRIWRMHFGRGLVATQEDFGSQGRLPTHLELLDFLAATFMDEGWDVKRLHRLIVTSETFKQASQASREIVARDPENLLLARGPKTRLMAEAIRDSALAASGLLTRTIGGPSVKPYQPVGLWEQSGTGKKYAQDTGSKLYRRSLYTFWRRTSPPPSMVTFDAMSREVCTAKREVTATPLQSLVLLNDPQFVEAARVLAQRVLQRFPNDEGARHREAFRALIGRAPDATEAAILARLFSEQEPLFAADTDGAAKLLGVGESPWDRTLPPARLAATTMAVSAIMNVDEFLVVR